MRFKQVPCLIGLVGLAGLASTPTAQAAPICVPAGASVECTFSTVGTDAFVVPPGVTDATFDVFGAEGGAYTTVLGGLGGRATATLPVTPGESLEVNVGGAGGNASCAGRGAGGFNGGGTGGSGSGFCPGAGGGGGSDVRRGTALADRLLVAGGGGGGGNDIVPEPATGGAGGGLTGGDGGNPPSGGAGGDQTGASGSGQPGTGSNGDEASGGGGGGYYGGAGGTAIPAVFGGGGGGSGFGPPGVAFETGVRSGDGLVVVTYTRVRCAPVADLVGCWPFDEAPGATTAADDSGFGNDGTYFGAPVLGLPGVDGTAAGMDGRDDHVRIPDDDSLDVGDSFTLEGFIRRDTDGHTHQLFNKGGEGFHLVVMSHYNDDQVWLRKAGNSTIARSADGVPADGEFHHVAATKDGPGTTKLYIDGVEQAVEQVAPTKVIEDTAAPLYFSATRSNVVDGALDAFAVHDRALSPAEVGERAGTTAPAPAVAATSAQSAGSGGSGSAEAVGTDDGQATSCAGTGSGTSGITALRARGLACARARDLTSAGPAAVAREGLTCEVTREQWNSPVPRITRTCEGREGRTLAYTAVG